MGWRLVPEEPTQEMVRAAYQAQPDAINAGFAQAYRNMLAEAPKPAGDIAAPVDADLVARCKEVLARQPGAALAAYSAKLAAVFGDKYASLADAAAVNSTQVEAMRELVRSVDTPTGNAANLLRSLKASIDTRINDLLCETKPGYDDSVVGINEAWDVVRKACDEYLAKASR